MVSVFAGVGRIINGRVLGVLLDGRNTFSLSRLQMVMWTILIVSALTAIAIARAYGLDSDPTLHKVSISTALQIDIPGELFAVMGISYFTGAAAPSVLSLRSQAGNTQEQINAAAVRMSAPVSAVGQVLARPSGVKPRLADLILGDDLASAGTVDLSKLQQLLITVLLVSSYFGMVSGMLLSDEFAVPVVDKVNSWLTRMPKFTDNFVALLAISHGGYLAYKASPRVPSAVQASVAKRPAPPDPNDAG